MRNIVISHIPVLHQITKSIENLNNKLKLGEVTFAFELPKYDMIPSSFQVFINIFLKIDISQG